MFKPEFVTKLAAKLDCPKKEAGLYLDTILDMIQDALRSGEEVRFVKFGKWEPKVRAAGNRANPLKGGEISFHPEKKRVKFTAATNLLGGKDEEADTIE